MKQQTPERTANQCSPESRLGAVQVIRLSPSQCSIYYPALHIWQSEGLQGDIQSQGGL